MYFNKCIIALIVLLTMQHLGYAISVSGFVRDAQTGEVLIGANVWEKSQNVGTSTDNRGYFNLKVGAASEISISYIGYKTQYIVLKNSKDSFINVALESVLNLEELTVTATREKTYDLVRISAKELMQIPSMAGKPDVIKALLLQPGVLASSEGMSIMMVRGGEPGQNQYLLDNVPLIYVNHLGGMFSVFNPDMINSIDFYKGSFPARHGGKLSSIVDITQREGDISKHQGSFSLGITDASVAFEGPLANKKMSYIVTARKTLVDALMIGATAISDANNTLAAYGFHDVNAKISYKPNNKNSFSLNLYQGDDYLNFWSKPWKIKNDERTHVNQQWGNWLVSGRWNSVVSAKIFTENIVSFSRYRNKSGLDFSYKEENTIKALTQLNRASVNDFSLRSAWKYSLSKNWNITFGGHLGFLMYEPDYNYISTTPTKTISTIHQSIESAVYVENKIQIAPSLLFQPSLRLSNFNNNGENFFELEPRINLTYSINNKHNVNLSYMQVSQNSHLVFIETKLLKREVWLPATNTLRPELSDQYSASWNGQFANGKYSAEANVYFKQMQNLVTLKEGYENMYDITGVDNKIEWNGRGTAYGLECMIKKNTGNWTGSLAYAYSYSNRQFANINNGQSYEFEYNRPHNISLNVSRNLGKNWTMSAIWLWQSGTPYTPELGKYYTLNYATEPAIVILYGDKNSSHMQPYHRLDVGFNHHITTKRGNKAIWTYSLYNAYNRINSVSYYLDNDKSRDNSVRLDRPLQLYKTGLFPIIPSIAYKVYFDFDKSKPKPEKPQKSEKRKFNWLYME